METPSKCLYLDAQFEQLIGNAWKFMLNLSHSNDRTMVEQWIQRLSTDMEHNNQPISRKNRNLYAHILSSMVQRGHINEPFTSAPPNGPLKIIPAYMTTLTNDSSNNSTYNNKQDDGAIISERNHIYLLKHSEDSFQPTSDIINQSNDIIQLHQDQDIFIEEILIQKKEEIDKIKRYFEEKEAKYTNVIAMKDKQFEQLLHEMESKEQENFNYFENLKLELTETKQLSQQQISNKITEVNIQHNAMTQQLKQDHIHAIKSVNEQNVNLKATLLKEATERQYLITQQSNAKITGIQTMKDFKEAQLNLSQLREECDKISCDLKEKKSLLAKANQMVEHVKCESRKQSEEMKAEHNKTKESFKDKERTTKHLHELETRKLTDANRSLTTFIEEQKAELLRIRTECENKLMVSSNTLSKELAVLKDVRQAQESSKKEYEKKLIGQKKALREKVTMISDLREQTILLKKEASDSIASFKSVMIATVQQIFASLNKQVDELQLQLRDSKDLTAKQSIDHTYKLEKIKAMHENEIISERSASLISQNKLKESYSFKLKELINNHSQEKNNMIICQQESISLLSNKNKLKQGSIREGLVVLHDQSKNLKEAVAELKDQQISLLFQSKSFGTDMLLCLQKHCISKIEGMKGGMEVIKLENDRLKITNQNLQLEMQKKISDLKLSYENKLVGCLPASSRIELESTIVAMQQQIHLIESRANVLQQQVNSQK